MAQPVSVRNIRNTFEEAIGSAINLYSAVEPFVARNFNTVASTALHHSQARRVVSLGFLAIVASWEEFIEGTFVRYLCGAASTMRRQPKLKFGPALRLDDAYSILAGRAGFNAVRQYLSWSVQDTLNRASLFFHPGDPFSKAFSGRKLALEDATLIRNRVAHSSQKARASFRTVVGRLRPGKVPRAYSVGDFLLERIAPVGAEDYNGETLFEAYLYLLRCAADEIAGLPSADRPRRDV